MAKTYKIFIVDDDKFLISMYAKKFGDKGHEVETALSTADAISKIKDGYKPEILLSDIVMPGMDGLDMIESLRNDNLLNDTMVIMLTNQGDDYDIERAKKLKVAGYIVKATSIPSEVVENVEKIASQKR